MNQDPDKASEADAEATASDLEVIAAAESTGDKANLAQAYLRLGLDQHGLTAKDAVKGLNIGGNGFKGLFGDVPRNPLLDTEFMKIVSTPIPEYEIPDILIDDSPQRTADATERMVAVLEDVHTVTADLVRLTNTNLQLTSLQQASSRRTERFTRWMTWASLSVAIGSLGVAVVAIFT